MRNDPIVEEVHRARERLLAECEGDLDKLMDSLQERESQESGPLVEDVRELKAAKRPLAS